MTNAIVTGGVVVANVVAVASAAVSELNPLLEFIQNGASVGALMAIFLWREVKRSERYEKLYDEERRKRVEESQRCKDCPEKMKQ